MSDIDADSISSLYLINNKLDAEYEERFKKITAKQRQRDVDDFLKSPHINPPCHSIFT